MSYSGSDFPTPIPISTESGRQAAAQRFDPLTPSSARAALGGVTFGRQFVSSRKNLTALS